MSLETELRQAVKDYTTVNPKGMNVGEMQELLYDQMQEMDRPEERKGKSHLKALLKGYFPPMTKTEIANLKRFSLARIKCEAEHWGLDTDGVSKEDMIEYVQESAVLAVQGDI